MARYQLKPDGEIVLIMTAVEARGLSACARQGWVELQTAGVSMGDKVADTAAQRAR